jgi:hypothetical protein
VTPAGIFLTHQDTPRIRRHFDRLVDESDGLVEWHWVMSRDPFPRPETSFAYDDPADVLPVRYRRMEEHGGVQGGYLDTLIVPVLRSLPADHLWVCEYDVDLAGRWGDFFRRFAEGEADLLTTTLLRRREQPKWPHWSWAVAPARVPRKEWVRSFNPLMRLSRRALDAYCDAMTDDAWEGHYEFTVSTALHAAGLVVEDLGGDTSFTPEGRRNAHYVGKSADRRTDLTFGFRPARQHYYEEQPEDFELPGLLYHPVKPGVPTWNRETRNVSPSAQPSPPGAPDAPDGGASG